MTTTATKAKAKPAHFAYLKQLRDLGTINMFFAAPYLADAFHLSKQDAKDILLQWMASFDKT